MTTTPARAAPSIGLPRLPIALTCLLAVALPLVPADIVSLRWHGLKTLVFEVGAAAVLALASVSMPVVSLSVVSKWRVSLISPLGFLGLLSFWAAVSYGLSAEKGFAFHGLWLLAGGAVVAGTLSKRGGGRAQCLLVLDALNVAAVVIGGSAVALYLRAGVPVAEGTYHDHMLLGAALTILLPMTLAAFVSPVSQARKTLAMIATVVCAAALLLSQTRSSWIGAAVGLLAFGALWLWCRPRGTRRREAEEPRGARGQALVYGILVVVALGGFLLYAQQNGLFAARAWTLTTSVIQGKEASVEWRFATWRGAVRMIEQRPLLGWGVGCYPLHQQPFTATGEPPAVVARNGGRIWDEAHNSYLQIAAELGLPGLILWLLTLGAAFVGGVGALRVLPDGGLRQRALIGGLAALAGQAVDALANPGWQFGEVAVYVWIVLGLVAGLTAEARGASEETGAQAAGGSPPWMRSLQVILALLACVWLIYEAVTNARVLPTPHL